MGFSLHCEVLPYKEFDRATQRYVNKTRWVRNRSLGGFCSILDPSFDDPFDHLNKLTAAIGKHGYLPNPEGYSYRPESHTPDVVADAAQTSPSTTSPTPPEPPYTPKKRYLTAAEKAQLEWERAERDRQLAKERQAQLEWEREERQRRWEAGAADRQAHEDKKTAVRLMVQLAQEQGPDAFKALRARLRRRKLSPEEEYELFLIGGILD